MNRTNWELFILTKLIKIHEQRYHYRSVNPNRVTFPYNDKNFKEAFIAEHMMDIDEAIQSLLKKGLIEIEYYRNRNEIKSLVLAIDKVDEIYKLTNIDNPLRIENEFLSTLEKGKSEVIKKYHHHILERISAQKSIKSYTLPANVQKDVVKAIDAIETLEEDIFIRNLSIQLFNDSKRLEEVLPKATLVYKAVFDDFNEEQYINKGLLKNPSYLYIKGDAIIDIKGEQINLKKVGSSIGIHSDLVPYLTFNVKKVTTIENLTTFNNYEGDGLILYLAGFSNNAKKRFLQYVATTDAEIYHFGDIDYGGFMILLDICESIGYMPKTINMDLPALKSKLSFVKKVENEAYIKKLRLLLEKEELRPYFDVIRYLIENKIILEQEAFEK